MRRLLFARPRGGRDLSRRCRIEASPKPPLAKRGTCRAEPVDFFEGGTVAAASALSLVRRRSAIVRTVAKIRVRRYRSRRGPQDEARATVEAAVRIGPQHSGAHPPNPRGRSHTAGALA